MPPNPSFLSSVSPGIFHSSWGILPNPAWPWKKGYTGNTGHPLVRSWGWTKIFCSKKINKSHVTITCQKSRNVIGRTQKSWLLVDEVVEKRVKIFIFFIKTSLRMNRCFFWRFFTFFLHLIHKVRRKFYFLDYYTRKNLRERIRRGEKKNHIPIRQ